METWTLRQAMRQVYPDLHFGTVQHWVTRGIMTPYQKSDVARGPGSGSLLDIADITTIGILRALFRFGLKYDEVEGRYVFDDYHGYLRKRNEAPKSQKFVIITSEEAKASISAYASNNRRIQEYLIEYDYQVIIYWAPQPKTPDAIHFFPMIDENQYRQTICRLTDNYLRVVAHLLIYAGALKEMAEQRLSVL